MDNLEKLKSLRNNYYLLRHGESEANIAGLITSDPAVCINNYGLTEKGRVQVTRSIKQAKFDGLLNEKTIIYCSDFRRTVETAEIACAILNAGKIHRTASLRERNFGEYDGKQITTYINIWAKDQKEESAHVEKGVESPQKMLTRLIKLLKKLEFQYKDEHILLVSHGDPLQVLQAFFLRLDSIQSISLKYIEQGELRELKPMLSNRLS